MGSCESVFDKLQDLGIFPSEALAAANLPASDELTRRVSRRAEQFRQEWNKRNGNGNPA